MASVVSEDPTVLRLAIESVHRYVEVLAEAIKTYRVNVQDAFARHRKDVSKELELEVTRASWLLISAVKPSSPYLDDLPQQDPLFKRQLSAFNQYSDELEPLLAHRPRSTPVRSTNGQQRQDIEAQLSKYESSARDLLRQGMHHRDLLLAKVRILPKPAPVSTPKRDARVKRDRRIRELIKRYPGLKPAGLLKKALADPLLGKPDPLLLPLSYDIIRNLYRNLLRGARGGAGRRSTHRRASLHS